jgi:hypothetical protein
MTWAQCGEDLVIHRLLDYAGVSIDSEYLTYIDVGANHPKESSNTYFFYERGVLGACVDPHFRDKEFRGLFEQARPKDILYDSPVGEDGTLVNFYYYEPNVYSTASDQRHNELVSKCYPSFVRKEVIECIALKSLTTGPFLNSKTGLKKSYFLSIDVESYEYSVIKSVDFVDNRPLIIVCEISGLTAAGSIFATPTHQLLMKEEYRLKAVVDSNFIYVDCTRPPFHTNQNLPFNL